MTINICLIIYMLTQKNKDGVTKPIHVLDHKVIITYKEKTNKQTNAVRVIS